MTEMFAAVSGHGKEDSQMSPTSGMAFNPPPHENTYTGLGMLEACQHGNLGVAILLWYQGADISRPDEHGITPLHQAAYHGKWLIVEFLLEHGAAVDPVNYNGNTPIMWAAIAGHMQCVSILASKGASLTRGDERGYTVLFHLAHNGHAHIMNFLANEFGNDLDWHGQDKDGHNLFQWACYKGFLGTARYLHEVHGVGIEVLDKESRTSLHWAAREGHYDVAQYVLSLPLQKTLNHRDQDGLTPAETATSRFHIPINGLINDAAQRAQAGKPRVDPFACRAASSVQLMMNNARYLRQFIYGLVLAPLFLFYVLKLVPVWIGAIGFPLATIVIPVVLDGNLFRRGQPPVRAQAKADVPSVYKTLESMALSGERNLAMWPVLLLLQTLLPYYFLTVSPIGAALQKEAEAGGKLMNVIVWGSAVGLLAFLLGSYKRPEGPNLKDNVDPETGARRIPNTHGAYAYQAMQRVSLRSVYDPLTHQVVACFDHYSVPLDNAIGKGNVFFYVLWCICLVVWTAAMSYSTHYWGIYTVADSDTKITACRVIGRFFFNGMPGGDPAKQGWWWPTSHEIDHMWYGTLPAIVCLTFLQRTLGWFLLAAMNITWHESNNNDSVPVTVANSPAAEKYPAMGGPPRSFLKPNGSSMYNLGGPLSNIISLLFGTNSGYNSKCDVATVDGYIPQ